MPETFVCYDGGFNLEQASYTLQRLPLTPKPDPARLRKELQAQGRTDESDVITYIAEKEASYQVQSEWAAVCPFEVTVYANGARYVFYGDTARRFLEQKGTWERHVPTPPPVTIDEGSVWMQLDLLDELAAMDTGAHILNRAAIRAALTEWIAWRRMVDK